MKKDTDFWRKSHLTIAEAIDAWRIVPRTIVVSYSYVVWHVIEWYMNLTPYLPDEFKPLLEKATSPEMLAAVGQLMIKEPTTQHSFLVSTVVGIAAAVFGLYSTSGRKWEGFTKWSSEPKEIKTDNVAEEPTPKLPKG